MRRLDVAPRAQADVDEVLFQSARWFGQEAAKRYRLLLANVLQELLINPEPLGARSLPESAGSPFLYHLRHARNRLPPLGRVHSPRHIVAYTFDADTLRMLRLLHDSMDLVSRLEGN